MSNALGLVFYQYTPRINSHYKTQSKLFLEYAKSWLPEIDTVYLFDMAWGFDDFHQNIVKKEQEYGSHWEAMNWIAKSVKEDNLLLLDPDIFIYDPKIVAQGFELLKTNDIVGILDNSGSEDLWPANDFRAVRRRFTPYLTFMRTSLFEGIKVDFSPTQRNGKFKYDSMGLLTKQILDKNPKVVELSDDRTTLFMYPDFSLHKTTNMDGPGYQWSEPLEDPKKLGYYHIRNSSLGLSLLNEFEVDKPAYRRRKLITPYQEALRLLAWQWICDEKAKEDWRHTFTPVLEDYKVPMDIWENYIKEFKGYHSWL